MTSSYTKKLPAVAAKIAETWPKISGLPNVDVSVLFEQGHLSSDDLAVLRGARINPSCIELRRGLLNSVSFGKNARERIIISDLPNGSSKSVCAKDIGKTLARILPRNGQRGYGDVFVQVPRHMSIVLTQEVVLVATKEHYARERIRKIKEIFGSVGIDFLGEQTVKGSGRVLTFKPGSANARKLATVCETVLSDLGLRKTTTVRISFS